MRKRTEQKYNVDLLFDKYLSQRQTLASNILESESGDIARKIHEGIESDNDCRRSMGSGEYRSPYACKKCSEMSEITTMRAGEIKTFEIEAGDMNGENMLVIRNSEPLIKIESDKDAAKRYSQLEKLTGLCNGPKNKIKSFLALTAWVNGLVMNYLVEKILVDRGIPHCLPMITGFVCSRNGYYIRPDLPCLTAFVEDISPDNCRSILQQIAITLHALSEYSFIHGSATIDRIHVDNSVDCNYQYDGYNLVGNFTVMIAEYHYSSITIGDTRLSPHPLGRNVNIVSALNNFTPVIQRSSISSYDIETDELIEEGSTVFKVTCESADLFTTMRYSGYPLFGGAYDMYSFFVSLMSWTPFANTVKSNPALSKLWSDLFPNKDQIPKISTDSTITCSYRIAEQLKGRWLYCDVIRKLLSELEKMIDFNE